MLDPNERYLYLDGLSPPEGYVLDRAIATTFSLDLLSLLMAPLSMSLFECQKKEDMLKDPIAILEALKRTTDNLAIFCQQGRISIPTTESLLYSNLEPIVVEMQPPNRMGVFHPKIWLLRFKNENDDVMYRFLCLSRNLTFDRSWDTILTIEGNLEDRINAFSRNRPLADFIKTLPTMAVSTINMKVQEHINIMADEVLRVNFKLPDDFDEFFFLPLGINGYTKPPTLDNHNRLMIMSPFISDQQLRPLVEEGSKNVLISRVEGLDALNDSTYAEIEANSNIFIMEEAAERPEDVETAELEVSGHNLLNDLSGLHGKLYISEKGWDARIITGSANATNAAFSGQNVEFLVELIGKKSKVGIEHFLGNNSDKASFRSLLRPYQRSETLQTVDKIRKKLEKMLDEARSAISRSVLSLTISQTSDETFSLYIISVDPLSIDQDAVKGRCYPISLKSIDSQSIEPLMNGNTIIFNRVSIVGLTGFFAFELEAHYENQTETIAFVLNLPVIGMPSDRDKQILKTIISDRNGFIRYLLFLLAEGSETYLLRELVEKHTASGKDNDMPSFLGVPLFEEMVRAYSRHPEKITRISKLIDDLKESKEGNSLLPDGFERTWGAILAARFREANL